MCTVAPRVRARSSPQGWVLILHPAFSTAAMAVVEGSWAGGGAGPVPRDQLVLCWQLGSSATALGPGRAGAQDEWDHGQSLCPPRELLAAVPSGCARSVLGWEQSALPARQSRPRLHPHPCASCSGWGGVRCLLLCLALCVRPGPVLLEPPCARRAVPDCPLCSQEAG